MTWQDDGDGEGDEEQPGEKTFDTGDKKVLDEEATVDQKVKDRIITSRKRVDRAEEGIFIEAPTDPHVDMPWERQVVMWGVVVKQFLRNIEPLLRSDKITESRRYYKQIQVTDKPVTVYPPQTEEYDFSIISSMEEDEATIKRELELPPDAELPRPKRVQLKGLEDVIEHEPTITASWSVKVTEKETIPLHNETIIPREVYVNAVRYADRFLQQAGIGVKTGMPETDDQNEPW
jgi:hypothetical protein